jgi:hypothetical protein
VNKKIMLLTASILSIFAPAQAKTVLQIKHSVEKKLQIINQHIDTVENLHNPVASAPELNQEKVINTINFKLLTNQVRLIHKLLLWSKMNSLKKHRSAAYMQRLNYDRKKIAENIKKLKRLYLKAECYSGLCHLKTEISQTKTKAGGLHKKLLSLKSSISQKEFFIQENSKYKRRVLFFTLLRPSLYILTCIALNVGAITILFMKHNNSLLLDVLLLTCTVTGIGSFLSLFIPWEIIKK